MEIKKNKVMTKDDITKELENELEEVAATLSSSARTRAHKKKPAPSELSAAEKLSLKIVDVTRKIEFRLNMAFPFRSRTFWAKQIALYPYKHRRYLKNWAHGGSVIGAVFGGGYGFISTLKLIGPIGGLAVGLGLSLIGGLLGVGLGVLGCMVAHKIAAAVSLPVQIIYESQSIFFHLPKLVTKPLRALIKPLARRARKKLHI